MPPSPTSSPERAEGGRAALRVLVIDDEAALLRAIRMILERHGCRVTSAASGEEGLERARREPYDLILCDLRLPGFDGRELYDRLRADVPEAAGVIAFMTGDIVADETRRFLDGAGRPTLPKPFGTADLLALLPGTDAR